MRYRRLLIKLSGEMLGRRGSGFERDSATGVVDEILAAAESGFEIAILIGGGNIIRARDAKWMERVDADYMGMCATLINALGLKAMLKAAGLDSVVMSTLEIPGVTETVSASLADTYLKKGRILIYAGGTGSPFFTTDTAAALRALEIDADLLLKATKVDGVYDRDPETDSKAELLGSEISFREAAEKNVRIMDPAALSLLEDNALPAIIFNFYRKGNLGRILKGESVGTRIS